MALIGRQRQMSQNIDMCLMLRHIVGYIQLILSFFESKKCHFRGARLNENVKMHVSVCLNNGAVSKLAAFGLMLGGRKLF